MDILLSKFDSQININNYMLQSLDENKNNINGIDQKLGLLNVKMGQIPL